MTVSSFPTCGEDACNSSVAMVFAMSFVKVLTFSKVTTVFIEIHTHTVLRKRDGEKYKLDRKLSVFQLNLLVGSSSFFDRIIFSW